VLEDYFRRSGLSSERTKTTGEQRRMTLGGCVVEGLGMRAEHPEFRKRERQREKIKTAGLSANEFLNKKLASGEYIVCEVHKAKFSRAACLRLRADLKSQFREAGGPSPRSDATRYYFGEVFRKALDRCSKCPHLPKK
jgi:hypothetical protein